MYALHHKTNRWSLIALLLVLMAGQAPAQDSLIKEVRSLSGVQGGILCMPDVTDGTKLSLFAGTGRYLVHGICDTERKAQQMRRELAEKGLAGIARVEFLESKMLPYNERTVSLMVVEDLPALAKKIGLESIEYVLIPQGTLVTKVSPDSRAAIEGLLKGLKKSNHGFEKTASGEWLLIRKRPNPDLDDWSHHNHLPDNNLVSRDRVLEAPNLLQWITGPTRNHGRHNLGPAATRPNGVISAGGKSYYRHGNYLIARNAFSGVMLWFKSANNGMSQMAGLGDELYICLGGKLEAWDADTGEVKRSYGTGLACSKIYVMGDHLFAITKTELLVYKRLTGEKAWSSPMRLGLASDGRLYGSAGKEETICVSAADGKEIWRRNTAADTGGARLSFVCKGVLVFRSGTGIVVLHSKDGRKLWSANSNKKNFLCYQAAGLLWVEHSTKTPAPGASPKWKGVISRWDGHDLLSGEIKKKTTGPTTLVWRCHGLYATDRFMVGNRPIYFMDWLSGESHAFEGTRAECGTAYRMAQGLFLGLYTSPGRCMCMSTAMAGVTAYAADHKTPNGEMAISETQRLVKGEALPPTSEEVPPAGQDWPMYRADMKRSANAGTALPPLKIAWKARIGGATDNRAVLRQDWLVNRPCGDRLTAPTIAAGKVFVALRHEGVIAALDAKTGKVLWKQALPGRINAPPTYHQGICMTGCNDGRVYAHRADNGKSLWTYRAAPDERRMMAYGQVESAWPLIGGVLMVKNRAFVVAGRQVEIDGGLYIHALDPQTGKAHWTHRHAKMDQKPFGGYTPRRGQTHVGTSDVLCSNGKFLSMSGANRGKLYCDTGRQISNYDRGIRFSWNPTRYRRDQFGIERVPVAYVTGGYVTLAKGNAIKRYGKSGWQVGVPGSRKVEAIIAISGSAATKKSTKRPVVRAPRLDTAPVMDGTIEALYQEKGTALTFGHLNGNRSAPKEATTAWVLSDAENLYLAFRCEKPDPGKVVTKKTKRDDAVWQDEAVEIFLDPRNLRGSRYYHFMVNSAGVFQDNYEGSKKWNGDLVVKTGVEEKAWTAEVKVPFATLGLKPDEMRHLWSMNLNRSARKFGAPNITEDTAWAPTGTNSSHEPDMFGYLWLDAARGGKDDAAYQAFYAKTAPTGVKANAKAKGKEKTSQGEKVAETQKTILKHPASRASFVKAAPTIDGTIDAVYEKQATPLTFGFLDANFGTPNEKTMAWILSDEKNLYVAFRCFKKDPNKLLARQEKRDDEVWKDEVVEMFLNPQNKRDNSYYHIIINSKGVVQDAQNKSDIKWNPELEVKCGKEDKAWTAEIRIPFAELGITDAPNTVWSVNINRSARDVNYPAGAEDTAWAPTGKASSHVPEQFGYLWIDGAPEGRKAGAFQSWVEGLPRIEKKKPKKVDGDVILAAIANSTRNIKAGGVLQVLSAKDGAQVGEVRLSAAPTWDGIAAANGRVVVTLQDGSLVCIGEGEATSGE